MIIYCSRACLSLLLHWTCKDTGISKHYHLPPLQKHTITAKKSEYNILQGDSKLSLNGWRICNSRNVHINFNCADLVVKLGNNYNLYKISILQTAIRKATTITWRKISKVTENYCNMYCCILIFVSVHRVSDFIHYQASVISDCSHNDLSSIKIAMLITSSDNYMKL